MDKSHYDKLADELVQTGDYKVIKRFEPVEYYNENSSDEIKIGIYLDTETTGMDADEDEIIELALVPFEFDKAGNIYRLLPAYNAFQDPGLPIPEIITQITGITDDMVKGQSIDLEQVSKMLSEAVIFIAHKFGFFYEGHRATIDCQAGIEILSRKFPVSGDPVLSHLLKSARRTDIRLWAEGAPFDRKDVLKKRGYRWSPGENGKRKAWYKDLSEDELEEEMKYLNDSIYTRAVGVLPTDKFNAKIRYSQRI